MFETLRGWFRRARRHGGRRRGGAVCSRVLIPAVVAAPVDVLRELRAYDDRLDLYTLPDGRVWLLVKSDKMERIDQGRIELAQNRGDGLPADRSALLMAAGFELLSEEPFCRLSATHLLRVAQQKMHASGADIRAAVRIHRAESDSSARILRGAQQLIERVESNARSDHRWAYRGRRSFSRVM